MSPMEERIFNLLDSLEINYECYHHEQVYNCPKMAVLLSTEEAHIAKSMLMKKSNGGYLLAVLPGNMKVDYVKLANKIADAKSLSLSPIEEAGYSSRCRIAPHEQSRS